MASSLSNLVDNCAEGFHKIKCKYGHGQKLRVLSWIHNSNISHNIM